MLALALEARAPGERGSEKMRDDIDRNSDRNEVHDSVETARHGGGGVGGGRANGELQPISQFVNLTTSIQHQAQKQVRMQS